MNFQHSIIRAALTAALSLSALLCSAQGQQNMRLQFMTFPQVMEPMEVELLIGKDKTIKLEIPSNEFSETYNIPRLSSLVFGKTTLNEAADQQVFDVYGQGKPATAAKQLVLLLRKGKNISDGFVVRAIPSNTKSFGGGKLLFLNATQVDVGGRAGLIPFSLKPGAQTIIKPKLEKNGRLAYVEFFYSNKGKPIPFFNSMWPVGDGFRVLVFFYQDPINQNKIKLHSFREFLPEDE